ncbi:hypothetical protein MNBD_NITROSPINAE03-1919 [hydrothermal vent metagenome]|uniref:DUF302 domain-containing protein n=1 Tax=hydrothermal vent metagenome TaxID=652676 RepID=A0A3B1C3N6_9ZZZZ
MKKNKGDDIRAMGVMLASIILSALFITYATPARADGDGLITKKSANSVKVTIDILEAALKKKGIRVFARVDHQANGATVNLSLRPTTVLIFGNPKLGTPLMSSNQTIGIDLPMKALAWKDASGQVWLTYNDPKYLAHRHAIKDKDAVIKKMTGALNNLSNKATGDGR